MDSDASMGVSFKAMGVSRSSNIELVGHDQGEYMLVKFRNGGHYLYKGVGIGLAEAMVKAPSIGAFFHANIRGKFPFRKLTDEELALVVLEGEGHGHA